MARRTAVRGRRDRVVSPDQADRLLAVLTPHDRALWGAAVYAGVRRGELMALRWEDVDLDARVLRVERAYDPKAREFVEPKAVRGGAPSPSSRRYERCWPSSGWAPGAVTGSCSAGTVSHLFDDSSADARVRKAWRNANLEPLTLHEARHRFASLMIAAGVNAKALATYMGHASVTITYDR